MNKQQYKEALKCGRIIIIGCKYTKNGWVGFKVYWIRNHGKLTRINGTEMKNPSYWNEKGGYWKCGAWGTDRRLEIILGIGYSLGLKFHDMRQNYQWLQDTWDK